MRKLMAAIAAAVALAACSSLDCSINNTVAMNVGIPDTLQAGDTLNVYTIAGGADTAIYTNGYATTSLSLPMSYNHGEDLYIFAFTDTTGTTVADTVTIAKTNQPHFESVDCTPQFWHTIQGATTTHNRLDSVTIINTNVDNDQTKLHITLHLRSH